MEGERNERRRRSSLPTGLANSLATGLAFSRANVRSSSLAISKRLLAEIDAHDEITYPEEAAGFLLGRSEGAHKRVEVILPLTNTREDGARHNRYQIAPEDFLHGEQQAARLGLDVIGVFHSHPDHPNRPSEYDRAWALPRFTYLITSVNQGQAGGSRAWLLEEDRSSFREEAVFVLEEGNETNGDKLPEGS